jgi:hypothetical protein
MYTKNIDIKVVIAKPCTNCLKCQRCLICLIIANPKSLALVYTLRFEMDVNRYTDGIELHNVCFKKCYSN